MLDERKVLRMTKMAFYESHGGKRDKAVSRYFRGDYVGMHLLISFIFLTMAFLAAIAAYLCFNFEEVMSSVYTLDLVSTGKKVLFIYVVALVVYLAFTYVIYQIRYRKARRRLNLFVEHLDRLDPSEE